MSKITFKSPVTQIDSWNIVKLPLDVSAKLPSRGLVYVKGTLDGSPLETVLEPDGKKSHWFKVDKKFVGKTVTVEMEATKDWPEPEVPDDLQKALDKDKAAEATWLDITPLARWDWIRWIRSTNNPETRKIRIEKTFSKFRSGKRQACCFNRAECTVPEISQKGKLVI